MVSRSFRLIHNFRACGGSDGFKRCEDFKRCEGFSWWIIKLLENSERLMSLISLFNHVYIVYMMG